jgi:hypothetical protein
VPAKPDFAGHWTEAGEAKPAIAAWRKTGEAAYARHAFKEAEEGYRQALAILNTLPESPERDARELELTDALIRHCSSLEGTPRLRPWRRSSAPVFWLRKPAT